MTTNTDCNHTPALHLERNHSFPLCSECGANLKNVPREAVTLPPLPEQCEERSFLEQFFGEWGEQVEEVPSDASDGEDEEGEEE